MAKKKTASRHATPRGLRGVSKATKPSRRGRAAASESADPPPQPRLSARSENTTIVGVGASAGGLEAFSSMVRALPADTGLAVGLVQHLAPQHESALTTLLASHTTMPVVEVTEG